MYQYIQKMSCRNVVNYRIETCKTVPDKTPQIFSFALGTSLPCRYLAKTEGCRVEVEVTLQLTVSQSVSQSVSQAVSGYVKVSRPLWDLWPDITFCPKVVIWELLSCLCKGRPLVRGGTERRHGLHTKSKSNNSSIVGRNCCHENVFIEHSPRAVSGSVNTFNIIIRTKNLKKKNRKWASSILLVSPNKFVNIHFNIILQPICRLSRGCILSTLASKLRAGFELTNPVFGRKKHNLRPSTVTAIGTYKQAKHNFRSLLCCDCRFEIILSHFVCKSGHSDLKRTVPYFSFTMKSISQLFFLAPHYFQ
jgi:hypothetical protein